MPPPMPVPSVRHTTWLRPRPAPNLASAHAMALASFSPTPGSPTRSATFLRSGSSRHARLGEKRTTERVSSTKPAAPRPTASMSRPRDSSATTSATVSATASESCAGVGRSVCSTISPSSFTTPAAILVPPMSTPMVSAISQPFHRAVSARINVPDVRVVLPGSARGGRPRKCIHGLPDGGEQLPPGRRQMVGDARAGLALGGDHPADGTGTAHVLVVLGRGDRLLPHVAPPSAPAQYLADPAGRVLDHDLADLAGGAFLQRVEELHRLLGERPQHVAAARLPAPASGPVPGPVVFADPVGDRRPRIVAVAVHGGLVALVTHIAPAGMSGFLTHHLALPLRTVPGYG